MANDPSDPVCEIRGMRFPPQFIELWLAGNWEQPEESLIQSLIPWLQGPIEFIENMRWLASENRGSLADFPVGIELFQQYHGNDSDEKPDLPWLDIDQALFIAVNRISGDDLAIAIDFRTSVEDPRVVASKWCHDPHRVEWVVVTETFSEFLSRLELTAA